MFRASKKDIEKRKKLVKEFCEQGITSSSEIKKSLWSMFSVNSSRRSIKRDMEEFKKEVIESPKKVLSGPKTIKKKDVTKTVESGKIKCPCGKINVEIPKQKNQTVMCATCGCIYDKKDKVWL